MAYKLWLKHARTHGKKSPYWTMFWKEPGRKSPRSKATGTKNRRAAEQKQTALQARFDVGDYSTDHNAEQPPQKKTITNHLHDYTVVVRAREGTAEHKRDLINRVNKFIADCKITDLDQITKARVEIWLSKQKTKDGRPIGRTTRNRNISAIHSYTTFLIENDQLPDDPLASLKKARRTDADRRYTRRALLWPEFLLLLAATQKSTTTRRNLTPIDRVVLYLLAGAASGFRRSSLARLTVADFNLGDQPWVALPAAASKNRRTPPPTPLAASVAETIRGYIRHRGLGPQDLLFPRLTGRTAEVLQADLREAGVPIADAQGGNRLDMHSLRYSFNHFLDRHAGASLTTRQALLHHARPELTANEYGTVLDAQLVEAVDALPVLPAITFPPPD